MVLAAVQQNGDALRYASKDLRADREVVLTAVRQNGLALEFANDDLRADREVVLAAVQQAGLALQFADETLLQDEQFVAELADVCPLGIVWRYKPQVTLEETARRAMRSKDGLLLLAKQARVSLLGNPSLMKELLLSAMEQGCLKETLQMLIAGQQKDILDVLRTVMAWYGAEVSPDLLTNAGSADALCKQISGKIVGKTAGALHNG